MAKAKYFLLNKTADFERGYGENIQYGPEGISTLLRGEQNRGVFISRLLDSREKETTWHRMVIRGKSLGESSIQISFYASESRFIEVDGETMDLGDYLLSRRYSAAEKKRTLGHCRVAMPAVAMDMLLHAVQGRYLWFVVELYGQGEQSPVIESIKIYLPKETWLRYLPEIYQSDPQSSAFLERYLGIFQSLYDDMDHSIRGISKHFDTDVVKGEFLQWLAGWIDIDDSYLWDEEQLRYLLKNGMALYRLRGTRQSVAGMVKLYTGEEPYIVERSHIDRFAEDPATAGLIASLYGEDSSVVTVVVSEQAVPSTGHQRTLLKILEGIRPVHIRLNLIVLKPYIFLDRYSYLGLNSVLGQYNISRLSGAAAISFAHVAGSPDNSTEGKEEIL